MSEADRRHWDGRYEDAGTSLDAQPAPPTLFSHVENLFPTTGSALEVACGPGRAAVWLAKRGMNVWGLDVSPVAVEHARQLAQASGVSDRCQFDVHDFDHGLPGGDAVDLVLCHLFRDASIDGAMVDRLKPGGMLAVACLSEVGHGPGKFRARPGELTDAFGHLDVVDAGEAEGHAWIVARA